MKTRLLILALLPFIARAQDGTLIDPSNSQTRQASAALEVYSTNQGFLAPRVTLASTADAATVTGVEPTGLMVYNTATAGDVTPGYYYWTGSAWNRLHNGTTNLSGSGTTNYLARWTPNGNTLGIGVTYDNGTNVGISTTTPGAKLDVNGGNVRSTTSGDAKFEFFGSSSDRGFVGWQASAPVGVYLWNRDNTPIYFGTTNAERMRIDAAGNVGINATAPGAKLDVTGGDIRISTDNNSLLLGSTAATQYALHNYTSNSLWLQNNGNTTSKLVVATAFDWDRQVAIQYTPGTTGSAAGDLVIGQIDKNNTNWTHGITRFYTNGTERLRIVSNGNVGIGATAPIDKLNIESGNLRFGTNAVSYQNAGAGATYGAGDPTNGIGWGNQPLDEYGIFVAPQENVYGDYTRLTIGWLPV